jgi:uracil-DNA glycosylase
VNCAAEFTAEIRNCRRCTLPAESYPIAVPFCGQRFFLLGQAPGKEELRCNQPFAGPAGRNLFRWFADAGMGDEAHVRHNVFFSAVAHCWPGMRPGGRDDLPPSREMRRACLEHVLSELEAVDPDWVVAVGGLAQESIFGRRMPLDRAVGPVHTVTWGRRLRFVLVLPHPSGLSRWLNSPGNRLLHAQAMRTLASAWRGDAGASRIVSKMVAANGNPG